MSIHCMLLDDTEGLQQGDTVSHDTATSQRPQTKESHCYTGTKAVTSSSTVQRAQGCVTGFKDENASTASRLHDSFDPAACSSRHRSEQHSLSVAFSR